MSPREQTIIKALLNTLRVAEPTLLNESVLHGGTTVRVENEGHPRVTLDEFEAALRLADGMGLLRSDRNALTGNVKWTLSPNGRVALKDL